MSLERHQTIVINQSLAASNLFSINLQGHGIHFQPTKMIIRQILYSNIAGADMGTYLLWSSMFGRDIAAIYVGIQGVSLNPQSVFTITAFSPSIDFRLTAANAAFTGPTGNLTLTLEFIA
jgi:hypothetical protein